MFSGKRANTHQRRNRSALSAPITAIAAACAAMIIATPCFGMDVVSQTIQPPVTMDEKIIPPSRLFFRGSVFSPQVEEITLTYDISNDCGLDANAIMNEEDNTLKEGLIAATTSIVTGILHEEFGSGDGEGGSAGMDSGAIHHKENIGIAPYYTDEHPVVIDRILDIDANCVEGHNCLLVLSTVSVLLDPDGDVDADALKKAVVGGMQDSFEDGSFFWAVPASAIVCPEIMEPETEQPPMDASSRVIDARSPWH